MTKQQLSQDSLAMLLLCSPLALPKQGSDIEPLSLPQWNELATKLVRGKLRPASLFAADKKFLRQSLGFSDGEAQRILQLLSMGGLLSIELERLGNLGIWVTTRAADNYPYKLKLKMRNYAPPVVYGAGDMSILDNSALALVGSRQIDKAAQEFVSGLASRCQEAGYTMVSGDSSVVDEISQEQALATGGSVIVVSSEGLEKKVVLKKYRAPILDGRLTLFTTTPPQTTADNNTDDANKYRYVLADYSVVISTPTTGEIWDGATESLANNWTRLLVRAGNGVPKGNVKLIEEGGVAMEQSNLQARSNLKGWLKTLL